jgi:hypothetical protein
MMISSNIILKKTEFVAFNDAYEHAARSSTRNAWGKIPLK